MRRRKIKPAAEDSAQRFRNRLLWSVSTVAILGLTTPLALAQDCDTDQDPIEYDSTDDLEPDEVPFAIAWPTICVGVQGEDFATITDGILIIDDNDEEERASYCRSSIFLETCDPTQDAVYEFLTKVLTVDDPPSSWVPELAFICGMRNGEEDFRVGVTKNQGVGFFDSSGEATDWLVINGEDQRVTVDWTKRNLFRVEKDDTEVRLFKNNEDTASVTVALEDLVFNLSGNVANLAVTSTPGTAKFELPMFRYRIGTTSFDNGGRDCVADIDDDGDVDVADLLLLLAAWGPCTGCDEDLDDDDNVGVSDLLILLASWGSCP